MSKRVLSLLKFLAQSLDVTVNGTIININLIIVGGIHQSVAAIDYAGTCGERLQDQKFGDAAYAVTAWVSLQLVKAELLGGITCVISSGRSP